MYNNDTSLKSWCTSETISSNFHKCRWKLCKSKAKPFILRKICMRPSMFSEKVIIYFTNKAFQFVAMVYHKHTIDEWWCHLLRHVPNNSGVRILVLSLCRCTCQQKSWVRVWMNVVLFLKSMRHLRDLLSPRRKRSAAKETPLFSPVLSCRVNMYVLTLLLVVQLMCMCN